MTTLPPDHNGEQAAQPAPPVTPPVTPPAVAPQPQPEQPQYQAPPAGAYQQPPAGAYQQPPAGGQQLPPQQTQDQAANTITLNYWLSVFFVWVPALIFWIIEKDKGNPRALAFHVANLNFALLRTGVAIAGWILIMILPFPIDLFVNLVLVLANIALFVFHILAAVKAPEAYRSGNPKTDQFIFNIPLIKGPGA